MAMEHDLQLWREQFQVDRAEWQQKRVNGVRNVVQLMLRNGRFDALPDSPPETIGSQLRELGPKAAAINLHDEKHRTGPLRGPIFLHLRRTDFLVPGMGGMRKGLSPEAQARDC